MRSPFCFVRNWLRTYRWLRVLGLVVRVVQAAPVPRAHPAVLGDLADRAPRVRLEALGALADPARRVHLVVQAARDPLSRLWDLAGLVDPVRRVRPSVLGDLAHPVLLFRLAALVARDPLFRPGALMGHVLLAYLPVPAGPVPLFPLEVLAAPDRPSARVRLWHQPVRAHHGHPWGHVVLSSTALLPASSRAHQPAALTLQ